jgi:hypothetical protein
MSYIPGIFIRDYRDYLGKKRSASSFCKKSNINDPFCKQINAQGQYLLYKTNQTPCFWVIPPLIPIIPKKKISCGACYSDSCKELNALYNGVTASIIDANPQYDLNSNYRFHSSVAPRRLRFAPIAGVSITNSIMQQSKMVQGDISSDDDSDNLSLSLDGDESSVWSETTP